MVEDEVGPLGRLQTLFGVGDGSLDKAKAGARVRAGRLDGELKVLLTPRAEVVQCGDPLSHGEQGLHKV